MNVEKLQMETKLIFTVEVGESMKSLSRMSKGYAIDNAQFSISTQFLNYNSSSL